MLGYLERLTLAPAELGPADLAPLRAAGLSQAAIVEAVSVAALFNIIDRVADALDFHVPPPEAWAARAPIMLAMGYGRFAATPAAPEAGRAAE
jgi:hypothetical protein